MLSVREPMWAIIFKWWPDEPTYHRKADWQLGLRTVCGRKFGLYTALIPLKHAKKFGKPCKGCFPVA